MIKSFFLKNDLPWNRVSTTLRSAVFGVVFKRLGQAGDGLLSQRNEFLGQDAREEDGDGEENTE